MVNKFRYPTGVRPLSIEETARRRRIESQFAAILERAGFCEIVLPIIDYAEPYSRVQARDGSKQSYRFVDREGELVAVRSDFTPMVARALAPSITAADLPLRIYYRGDVIRCDPSRLGTNREMFQIGAEIVGDTSDDEAIAVATEIASAFIANPLVVRDDLDDAGYYTGMRFYIYDSASRTKIAQGGRYDDLYAAFGTPAPAIGFTFTIDNLD
ncbi:MAG TPA: ATP phosphoribosyltransferase regulatory subunit [Thermoanaerobaculia bacterium]